LLKLCKYLDIILKDGDDSDISVTELCDEIQSIKTLLSDDENSPLKILQYLKTNELQNALPSLRIASYRILLTIPVTVAACERSFSKLKLIKTYLRSSMSNERLNSLALLSIENAVAQKMDTSESIKRFADMKARKKNF
jgi:hypothetical protein